MTMYVSDFIVLLSMRPTTRYTFKLLRHVMGGAIIVMNVKRNPFFIDQFFLRSFRSYRIHFLSVRFDQIL